MHCSHCNHCSCKPCMLQAMHPPAALRLQQPAFALRALRPLARRAGRLRARRQRPTPRRRRHRRRPLSWAGDGERLLSGCRSRARGRCRIVFAVLACRRRPCCELSRPAERPPLGVWAGFDAGRPAFLPVAAAGASAGAGLRGSMHTAGQLRRKTQHDTRDTSRKAQQDTRDTSQTTGMTTRVRVHPPPLRGPLHGQSDSKGQAYRSTVQTCPTHAAAEMQ